MTARPRPVRMVTAPFPGFPTDMQAQLMAALCVGDGSSVVTEQVFNLNGLGRLLVDSVTFSDYTMTQGIVMTIVLVFVFTNFVVDLLYAWLDPRIRYS